MQLNRIVLIGRLTRDPEERFTSDGVETSKFRIAVNRPKAKSPGPEHKEGDADADFFNVVCFRHTAHFVNQYMRRGNLVAVDGQLHVDEYTDREWQKRTWVEVAADNVQNLTPRGEEAEPQPHGRRGERDRDFDEDEPPQPRTQSRREQPRPQGRGYGDDAGGDPFAEE